ncbi:uncharacterized protein LOC124942716 isoform X1 [Impatiens glandulifera]|uniref:uncharacterized protein LOC124942716 isoform X1 n=1 Tax=Impatiens glandulifera TaxID=253017 RepID=UPI001FB10A3F|nr:uncharacterized protein LOC124942716 isoform X1 [Impatiens glandulifera]
MEEAKSKMDSPSLPYVNLDSSLRALAGQAEGFGRSAIGGLHGPLYHVTTLEDKHNNYGWRLQYIFQVNIGANLRQLNVEILLALFWRLLEKFFTTVSSGFYKVCSFLFIYFLFSSSLEQPTSIYN